MNPIERRCRSTTMAALLTPVAVGLIYVGASCERYSPGPGKCESQWVTALAISGMGGAWSAGFWQPNQALRQRERQALPDPGPIPAGGAPEPEGLPDLPDVLPEPEPAPLPEPIAVELEPYSGPELARMTMTDLRAVARLAGLRELARSGKRADLVAALDGTERVPVADG